MARKRGLFSRIADFFRGGPLARKRRAERRDFARGRQTSARAAEDYARHADFTRQRTNAQRREQARRERERDPFRQVWMEQTISRPGRSYANHRELIAALPGFQDLDEDEQLEIWEDYIRYMINGESNYRRNDPRNPFWSTAGIHPRNFDWDEWRATFGKKSP